MTPLFRVWQSGTRAKKRFATSHVRKHNTLGTTPAVAARVELQARDLEQVVEMTAEYRRRKEDAEFEKAFAEAGI
jgi:hypothetical protein